MSSNLIQVGMGQIVNCTTNNPFQKKVNFAMFRFFLFKKYQKIISYHVKKYIFQIENPSMTTIFAITTLLTLAFILSLTHQCQPNSQIADFWSSTADFQLQANQSVTLALSYQTYNITLPRKYDRSSNLQYAFAIKDMETVSASIYYFDLLVLKTFQSSIVVNFIYEPNKWAQITYNYWISFRSDLYIGVVSFTQNKIAKIQDKYQVSLIIRDQSHWKSEIALVFLNGLRFQPSPNHTQQQHGIDFSIVTQTIKEGELIFSFICNNPLALSSITFSYIVFSPREIPLTSYGGVISEGNLTSTKHKELRYLLPSQNSFSIYGISSIQANKTFTFASSLQPDYTLTYGANPFNSLPRVQITYLFLGQNPASLCLKNPQCQQSSQLYVLGNECVKACPSSSKPVEYIDGAVECVPCPLNMYYSANSKKCACLPGYFLQEKSCVRQMQIPNGLTNARTSLEDSLSSDDSKVECIKLIDRKQNNKNIFLTIQAKESGSHNKNLIIKLNFLNSSAQANSYYCNKSEKEKNIYNCLLLYNGGIPKDDFQIVFVAEIERKTICQHKMKIQKIK